MKRIGNTIFFIGLIFLALAGIVGHPLCIPIGIASILLLILGGWLLSKPGSNTKPEKLPLSQKPPVYKLLAAIPAVLLIAYSQLFEVEAGFAGNVGLFLLAYASVGVVEIQLDKRMPNAKGKWDSMAGWKKLLISMVIIVFALTLFLSLMPLVAKLIYE